METKSIHRIVMELKRKGIKADLCRPRKGIMKSIYMNKPIILEEKSEMKSFMQKTPPHHK